MYLTEVPSTGYERRTYPVDVAGGGITQENPPSNVLYVLHRSTGLVDFDSTRATLEEALCGWNIF